MGRRGRIKMVENNKIEELINDLEGTCQSFSDGCDDLNIKENDLTSNQLDMIDERIFNCSTCGWWFESGEQDEDNNCIDCQDDNKEEE
jgi:hypothetical protein